ncbi:MAG: hypothetical protein IJU41_05280, partial [Clostridia bacterium]|nr:hypothetical protein [Clostridia bacterium]
KKLKTHRQSALSERKNPVKVTKVLRARFFTLPLQVSAIELRLLPPFLGEESVKKGTAAAVPFFR